jgi:hypothetical protein
LSWPKVGPPIIVEDPEDGAVMVIERDGIENPPPKETFTEIPRPEGPGETVIEHPDGTVTREKTELH